MRRILFAALLLMAGSAQVQAQNVAKAKEILNKVSAKYRSYKTIKADFTYTMDDKADKIKDEQKGTLFLKGKKFRLDLNGQQVLCDGSTLWTYVKENNEVSINNYTTKVMDIDPTQMFTMYEKGFLYAYMGEETVKGKSYSLIELTPTDKKQSFFKVKLYIDKSNNIFRSMIYDKSGTIYTYEINNLVTNAAMDDKSFVFDKTKYPKVSVVDLRTGGKK
jgi:outer membrane lipoprotein-sorting protein